MNLLVFEYITGGGFNQQLLPASLLAEGELMLKALLDDCSRIRNLSVLLMRDKRCETITHLPNVTLHTVDSTVDVRQLFAALLREVDAVWLVAPECDNILQDITRQVALSGKRLLGCSSAAVAVCADKWLTFQCLQTAGVITPVSALMAQEMLYSPGAWVIKPRDGVGCMDTWRVDSPDTFAAVVASLEQPQNFIIQPFIAGRTLSLSCIFNQGQGWVVCVNQQVMVVQNNRFSLRACKVNSLPVTVAQQRLVRQLAEAIPGLHGYVGIDLIQAQAGADRDEGELYVVDINPRLTSSYAGLNQALGINLVDIVMHLPQTSPSIQSRVNRQIDITLQ